MSDTTNLPQDFTGKTVIVTGAGSGIGRATAFQLAQRGAVIVVADISDTAEETVAAITAKGGSAVAVVGDISDPEVVKRIVAAGVDQGGQLNLVNNAGVMDLFAGAGNTDPDLWHRVIRINLDAPFLLIHEVLPHMRRSRGGAIVNVGSAASLRGGAAGAAYTASKHGLVGLTKNTAYTYRDEGIRANLIAPGGVSTNIMSSIDQTGINPEYGLAAITPIHNSAARSAEPEEQAEAIVFLLSDAASAVNGAIIPVDSGWAAG